MPTAFRDRTEAGQRLAERLVAYAGRPDVLVLALPRGGVPVAYEVARATQMGAQGEWNVGQLVRQRYGRDAVLVGFTTHDGTVTAASNPRWGDRCAADAGPSRPRLAPRDRLDPGRPNPRLGDPARRPVAARRRVPAGQVPRDEGAGAVLDRPPDRPDAHGRRARSGRRSRRPRGTARRRSTWRPPPHHRAGPELMGSVAEAALRGARCPVLTVKGPLTGPASASGQPAPSPLVAP